MGDPKGFIAVPRQEPRLRPAAERVRDYCDLHEPEHPEVARSQASRCMDCGVPFCQSGFGCPLHNLIPNWNDLVYRGRWRDALKALHATNNFPEFTGHLCPAPCEWACVLELHGQPVTICAIERRIAEIGWERGWVRPVRPLAETGRRVAVVGSGPAGLAAAQQLRRAGHDVTVFERADRPGGLLRYGIPDFKLDRRLLDRRLAQIRAEGVRFVTGVAVGRDLDPGTLTAEHDAILIAVGAGRARDLDVPGRDLHGIVFAMDYLTQQNHAIAGDLVPEADRIHAGGCRVLVIGGGDTGSDCAATALRQGAREVVQFEILPEPPAARSPAAPWPLHPDHLRGTHAHEEGCRREWAVMTTGFTGLAGHVRRARAVRVRWEGSPSRPVAVPGTEFDIEVDLVILAMGFAGVEADGLVRGLGLASDSRGNIATTPDHATSVDGVFAAGDCAIGPSLVVRALHDARLAAAAVNSYLMRP